jgi:hypothetical protein
MKKNWNIGMMEWWSDFHPVLSCVSSISWFIFK